MKAFRYVAYAYLCCHAFVAIAQDSGESLVEKLSDLSKLYENGLINEDEFLSAKNLLLSDGEITTTDSSDIAELSVNPDTLLRSEEVTSENDNRTAGDGVVTRESRLKIHAAEDSESSPISTQLIIQGSLIKIDTMTTSESLLSSALAVTSLATLGVDLSGAVTSKLTDDQKTTYLPMNEVVTEEVIRVASCAAVENNREIRSIHLVPSNSAYNSPTGWDDYSDISMYWEDYIELNDSWAIADETEEVVWLFYNLIVADELGQKNVNELPILGASGFVMRLDHNGLEISQNVGGVSATYAESIFGRLLGRLVPQYIPELPHPDCGSKSEIYLKLRNEISETSEISDLENFFDSLNISYERDRVKRSLLGMYKQEAPDRIEYPVRIELFHSRRPRTFERASIRYMID